MHKINTYYTFFIFFIFFIFYPLNSTLISFGLSQLPTFGLIPPFVLIGLLFLLLNYRNFIKFVILNVPLFSLFFLFSMIMIITQSYIFKTATYIPSEELLANNVFMFSFGIAGYIFAFNLKKLIYFFENNTFLLISFSSLWAMLMFILIFQFDIVMFLNRTVFQEVDISFQMISDFIVLGSFLMISKYLNNKYIYLIILIIFIELFILGSRSSMIFYIISIFFLMLKEKKFKIIFLLILIVTLLLSYYLTDIVNFYSSDYRALSILNENYANDDSLNERLMQFEYHKDFLMDTWFTGSIYAEYLVFQKGAYIHNYISYLENFGVIPFIFLNILILRIIFFFWKYYNDSFGYRLLFLMSSFTIMSTLFSRSYVFYWILIVLVMAESFININKRNKRIQYENSY